MLPAAPALGPVHHVGVACRSIDPVRQWIHATHEVTDDSGIVHDPHQDADLCLLSVAGGSRIELVAGNAVAGVVKRAHTYYHLCYEVASMGDAIAALEAHGCRLVSPPAPAVLFDQRPVAFLLGPTGLVELLEV